MSAAVIDKLGNADCPQRCAELVLDVAQDLGFALVSLTPDITDPQQPSFEFDGESGDCWTAGFLCDWHQGHSRMLNPTNAISRRVAQPFSWGRCEDDWSVSFSLDRQERKIIDRVFDQGISGAVTVPVHLPRSRVGKVSWIGRDRLAFKQLADVHRWWLSIISQIALDRLSNIVGAVNDNSAPVKLTPREVECLNWIARGKSDEDIACIMGLSYSSIRFHVNNAGRKLNCITRGHMIARATQQGWIGPV